MARHGLLYRVLSNHVFANITMALLLIGGAIGLFVMRRESFPDFDLDFITVSVPYPGADPDEVEEGICRPLEDALEGISGVKLITTTANEGAAVCIVECREGADVSDIKDQVKTRVDAITTFPDNAERPIVDVFRFDSTVFFVSVWGDLPERQLREVAYDLKDELVAEVGVSQITVLGDRPYEVSIEVSEEALQRYGLGFDQVAAAIRQASLNLPGGTLRTVDEELKLRVASRKYFAAEFAEIPVLTQPGGTVLRLGHVATLRDTFDLDVDKFTLFNGQRALVLNVMKTREQDSLRVAKKVREHLARKQAEYGDTVHFTTWLDMAALVQDRIDLLRRNGLIGLAVVFLVLWLFLDLRLSFWVTAGIPISLAGAFAIMSATGQSINMISLFGLIMVLGIIVDDAIVVGEAIYTQRTAGVNSVDACLEGTREVFWPVVMAVLTTMVAFGPLFFISGVSGKFIGVMPGPVVAALGVSLIEGLLILPVHLRHLPPVGQEAHNWLWRLNLMGHLRRVVAGALKFFADRLYEPGMHLLLKWRYAAVAAAVAYLLVVAGLMQGGLVKTIFFPETDTDYIMCSIELPNGTPIATTEAVNRQVLAGWDKTAEEFRERIGGKDLARAVFSIAGGSMPFGNGEMPKNGNNYTDVFIEMLPSEERNILYTEIVNRWRHHTGPIADAVTVKFDTLEEGPPGGDIEVDLKGRDQQALVAASQEVQGLLEGYRGVFDINSNYAPGKTELRISLKPAAEPLGLTLADVAGQLRQGFYGDELMRVQRGRDEVRIMLRYPDEDRRSWDSLHDVRIRAPGGAELPFHTVANVERRQGFASIHRERGRRLIRVSAAADETANTNDIMDDLVANQLPAIAEKYRLVAKRGESSERNLESIQSMVIGATIACLLIYLIMATIFRSYLQPLMIMVTIPLGLMGAVIGHYFAGLPISMMSSFGMVALAGIVVNDAIVLVVAINRRIGAGMKLHDAIVDGGKRRLRAIILTSLTTFGGLSPMILEKSFQAQFLIPMAISIAAGVLLATFFTLVFIPCILACLNDARRVLHLAWRLEWPTPEAVEPGAHRLESVE